MANLQIQVEDGLYDDARYVADQLGLDLATAVRMFLAQMARDNSLPFRPSLDPFYSPANQRYLRKVIADIEAGAELEAHELLEEQ